MDVRRGRSGGGHGELHHPYPTRSSSWAGSHAPRSGNTHSGLRTLLSNGELCPADTTRLLISTEPAQQSLPPSLDTQYQKYNTKKSPHFYPANCHRTIPPPPCTDRPSYYGKVLLGKGKWFLNCIPTCLLQDLHHCSILTGIHTFVRVISVLSQGPLHSILVLCLLLI